MKIKRKTEKSVMKAKNHHSGSAAMKLSRIAETVKNSEQQMTFNEEEQRTMDKRKKSNALRNRRLVKVCSIIFVVMCWLSFFVISFKEENESNDCYYNDYQNRNRQIFSCLDDQPLPVKIAPLPYRILSCCQTYVVNSGKYINQQCQNKEQN